MEARTACQMSQTGYDLATINSLELHDFLKTKMTEKMWIGLNDIATEGSYQWPNGEPLTDGIEFWGSNEPSVS